jgi:hypothetical protein
VLKKYHFQLFRKFPICVCNPGLTWSLEIKIFNYPGLNWQTGKCRIRNELFLLSIYDHIKSIDFMHGKSKLFKSSERIRTFIDKKGTFYCQSTVCRLSFNLETSSFQVKVFLLILSPIIFEAFEFLAPIQF